MKNYKKLLLIIAVFNLLITSCKKGEDDPFLSLRSRKARITGEWFLKSGSTLQKEAGIEYSHTYDGSFSYRSTDTIPYKEKWAINKNGKFERYIGDIGINATTIIEGTWSFGYKDESIDLKNKESIILRATKIHTNGYGGPQDISYSGTSCPVYSYTILQLKNKTMIIKYDGTNTTNNNSTSTIVGTMTYEQ